VGARQPFVVSIRTESGRGAAPDRVLIAVGALTPEPIEYVIRVAVPFTTTQGSGPGRVAVAPETERLDATLLAAVFDLPAVGREEPVRATEGEAVRALEEYFARLHLLQEASRAAGGLTCTSLDLPPESAADPDPAAAPASQFWLWRAGVAGLVLASLVHVVRDRPRSPYPCFKLTPLAGGRC
jgi:hypothetical protein